jgi:hypothetical protein
MSPSGQTRTSGRVTAMSVHPPTADFARVSSACGAMVAITAITPISRCAGSRRPGADRLAHSRSARHIDGMDDPKIRLYPDDSGAWNWELLLEGKGLLMAGRRARKRLPSRLPYVPLPGKGSAGPIDKRTLRQQSPNGPRQRDPNRDEGREL